MSKLRLGVAREIITPEVGGRLHGYAPDDRSESIIDDLRVTSFYFSEGDTKALMITADVCLIQNELDLEIRSLIEEKYDIPKDCIMLSATHTHTGPCTCESAGWGDIDREYCDKIFIPKILETVGKAMSDSREVTMAVGRGECYAAVNRRHMMYDNRVGLGQNPWGVMDPKMTILTFNDSEGNTYANMIHYACHGTSAGRNPYVSRDWSGYMTDRLEFFSKGVTAFFNGPEGDIGPRISRGTTVGNPKGVIESYVPGAFVKVKTYNDVAEVGHVAACDALKIYKSIFDFHDVNLKVSSKDINIPLKKLIPLEEAQAIYEKYKGETENTLGMFCSFAERVIEAYENGYEEKEYFTFRQTLIKIGNVVFASFPYELFSEIGLRIATEFKNAAVLSLSDTNGSCGYFITQEATVRAGYERDVFWYQNFQSYVDDADWHMMTQTVKHIKEIY